VDHSIFYKNDSLNTKEEDEDCAEFSDTPFSSEIDFFQSFIGIPHLSTNSISVGNYVGSGAFGEVYKGQWRNRSVALKTIDISHAKNYLYGSLSKDESFEEQILEALQWEVSRLSTVSHLNCVQFYGLFQYKHKIHLVMEFCDGGTLQKRLEKLSDIPLLMIWQWSLEMIQGLSQWLVTCFWEVCGALIIFTTYWDWVNGPLLILVTTFLLLLPPLYYSQLIIRNIHFIVTETSLTLVSLIIGHLSFDGLDDVA